MHSGLCNLYSLRNTLIKIRGAATVLFDIVFFFFVWFMFIVIWANIYCCYLSFFFFLKKKRGLRIMFGGKIDFGVMLCSQHFYDKSYAKSCY